MSGWASAVPWLRSTTFAVSVFPLRRNSVTSAAMPVQLVSWLARLAPAGAVDVEAGPAGAAAGGAASVVGVAAGAAVLAGGVASVDAVGSLARQAAASSRTTESAAGIRRFMTVLLGCASLAWRGRDG